MIGKKTGGRKKGMQNKYTYATKDALSKVVNDELNYLTESLKNMTDNERANIVIRLLPFVVSKDNLNINENIVHTISLS